MAAHEPGAEVVTSGSTTPPRGAAPIASVIVPAHNEASRIGDSLRALLSDAEPDEFDVVVVSNGSSDDTAGEAERAARALARRVRVVNLAEPSKAAAIRRGEELATTLPRIYLDADVACPAATARALVAALHGGAGVAVPSRSLDTTTATGPARAYYAAWESLPWVREQLSGRGVYALSSEARALFGAFPDVVADDRFATEVVPRHAARIVPEAVTIRPPSDVRQVLRTRRRVYGGNTLLVGPARGGRNRAQLLRLAGDYLRRPWRIPELAVFVAVTVVAKGSARRAVAAGNLTWGRAARPSPTTVVRGSPEGRSEVDVAVVTYRSARYVRDCVQAVDAALQGHPDARIILVDNGSRDDVAQAVAGASPRLDLVLSPRNDGFAAGCHRAADRSSARRILFVNPDATLEASCVDALLACARSSPDAGIVGGVAHAPGGEVDSRSWSRPPTLWSALCFGTGLSSAFPGHRLLDPESPQGSPATVPVVSGAVMLVDRRAWDQLGGFDPTYFLYGEDVDLCLRARSAGWGVRLCSEARYTHTVGASSTSPDRQVRVMRGRVTTYRRHLSRTGATVAVVLLQVGVALRAAGPVPRRDTGRAMTDRDTWRQTWVRRAEWRRGWDQMTTAEVARHRGHHVQDEHEAGHDGT